MTLLEAISPTARELLAICRPSKSRRHKVHAQTIGHGPLCGGGHGARSVPAWQEDIGSVTCAACLKIIEQRKKSS